MPDNVLDNLDVFYGELTPARATVYARLEGLENTAGLTLSGFVRGPRCFYSTTLLSTYPLSDAGSGPSLLAKALVPDPCYWSPETPNIYDVTVELRRGQDVIASEVRQIGFKPLGISGRFFTWEGKPWVLRGVTARFLSATATMAEWRDRSTVMIPADLSHNQLQFASEQGVISLAFIDGSRADELRRLTRYPTVALLDFVNNFPDSVPISNIVHSKHYQPNGFRFAPGDRLMTEDFLLLLGEFQGPIIAYRIGEFGTLSQARAACDKLQADLAPYGQFAGYIV
jgi:hypothetical protein